MFTHTHTQRDMFTHMHTHIHRERHTCLHTYTERDIHVYTHTHRETYMFTHMHTHTMDYCANLKRKFYFIKRKMDKKDGVYINSEILAIKMKK